MNEIIIQNQEYEEWKNEIVSEIHTRQLKTVLNINADTLKNYSVKITVTLLVICET